MTLAKLAAVSGIYAVCFLVPTLSEVSCADEVNVARTGLFPPGGPESLTELAWKFSGDVSPSASPVVSDGRVFVGSSKGGRVHAIDFTTGRERWTYKIEGGRLIPGRIWCLTAAIYKDIVVVPTDVGLYGIGARTGQAKWEYAASSKDIAIVGDVLYSAQGSLAAIDPSSGQELWTWKPEGVADAKIWQLAYLDGTLYCSGGRQLYAFDPVTRKEQWRFGDGSVMQSSTVADGAVFVYGSSSVVDRKKRETFRYHVYAISAKSGEVLWKNTATSRGSPVSVGGGMAFIGSQDANLYALDCRTGKEVWRFKTGGEVSAPVAISGNVVYVGSQDGVLYALDLKSGREKWRFSTGEEFLAPTTVSGGTVLFTCIDGTIYAVR